VREVSDAFLLQLAEVSAGLIGLFLVGVFFYVETGFRRVGEGREVFEDYFASSTKIVMILFAIPLGVSLTLVALEPAWSRVLFLLLCIALVAANLDTAGQIKEVQKVTRSRTLFVNEIAGTIGVVVLITLPWILGGIDPSREDLTWAILISFATAFVSILALVMSVFDVARAQRSSTASTGLPNSSQE
jgi:hypothetical protein